MTTEYQIARRTAGRIIMLLLLFAAAGTHAAAISLTREPLSSIHHAAVFDSLGTTAPGSARWSTCFVTVGWALLIRRRPH